MENNCSTCDGTGLVSFEKKANAFGPRKVGKKTCPTCKGTGK